MKYNKLTIFFIVFIINSNSLISQTKNNLSIETGLFHCFFDKSPLMNFNYLNEETKPFSGVLINSLGINYSRKINQKSSLGFEIAVFNEIYNKHVIETKKNVVFDRSFFSNCFLYERTQELNDKFSFFYGTGLTSRFGYETIIVQRFGNELKFETINRSDLGFSMAAGINYTPIKWLTFYSKFDLLSFIYIKDKETKRILKEIYEAPQFPSRFDLSWRFGLGINF